MTLRPTRTRPRCRLRHPLERELGRLSAVLALALAMVAPVGSALAQEMLSFDETRAYPVGANAKGFSVGDCDNDAIPDLIAAGQNSNGVVTLINDGTGVFHFGGALGVATQPTGAACGDFTGDGLIDIAAVSRDTGAVSFYRAEESGGFTLTGSRPAGLLPTSLTSGHLNADGNIDLVAVGSRSNDITVLLGTGSATLPPAASLRVPMDSPHSAAIADFNLDGNPDIAVAGSGDPFVVLLFGDGASFSPNPDTIPSPFADTRRPNHSVGIAAGDLNNDGSPDLAIIAANSSISLYLGNGAGGFTFLESISGPKGAEAVALADFNQDSLADLALLYASTNSAQVLFATGPAQFPGLSRSPTEQKALNSFGIVDTRTVLLDPLDAESTQIQLLALDDSPARIAVVQQSTLSSLSVTPIAPLADDPLGLHLADINGDAAPDVLVNRKTSRKKFPLDILLATGSGGFLPPATAGESTCGNGVLEGAELCDDNNLKNRDGCSKLCLPEIKGPVQSVKAAMLDGDGHMDLVVVDKSGYLVALFGDGTGRFLDVHVLTKIKRKTPAAVADFTADGIPDIVIVPKSRRSGSLQLLVNDGVGEFIPVAIGSSQKPAGAVLAGDFDGNGFTDVVAAVRNGWVPFYNDGLGPMREGTTIPAPRKLLAFAAADFDEDGWVDVLASFKPSRRTPGLLLYRGNPTGAFGAGLELPMGNAVRNTFVADVDQDLHQDIVSCSPSAATLCNVYYGNGRGEFDVAALPDDSSVGRDVRGAGAADFDGDGIVDLVGISRRDNRGKVMFRHTDRAQRAQFELTTGHEPAALAIVDLDNNLLPDIIVVNEGSNDISIFMSHGQRSYSTPAPLRLPVGSLGAPAVAVGDINGDGRPDLAVTQAGSDTVTPFLNLGGVLAGLGSMTVGDEPRGVALGNLNGDNRLDIVTANREDDTFSVLLSQPDGSYTRADYPSGGLRPSAVTIVDLDGNTFPDVVITNEKIISNLRTGNVAVFLNDGTGVFGAPASVHVRGRQTPRGICNGDFDGDGIPDVAVGSIDSNDVMVLLGNGLGGWRADERVFPVGQEVSSVWCFDADKDGRTDVAYGRRRAGDVGAVLTGAE